ncbi:MAG: hypothetical protein IJX93_03195 [Clostridia bacterium]|nr:hypothetical protein [Clostridia bacterium]
MKLITVTLSPALDIEYHTGSINPAGLNRTSSHAVTAGGKGINVSRSILNCAKKDGVCPALVTFAPLGGGTGDLFKSILAEENMPVTAVEIDGNTRINASLIPEAGESIEINAPGTPIGEKLNEIEAMLMEMTEPGDVAAICGSCPSDVAKTYPAELCAKLAEKGVHCVIDCDGKALDTAVNHTEKHPMYIKPNHEELADLTGMKTDTPEGVMKAAESVHAKTGITVITTMAGDGAVITDETGSKFVPAVKRPVVRLKGAGDTFLGAFLYAKYVKNLANADAVAFAQDVAGRYVAGE